MNELKKRYTSKTLETTNLENLIFSATTHNEGTTHLAFAEAIPELDFTEEQAQDVIKNWVWNTATQLILPNLSSSEGSSYLETVKSSMDSPVSTTNILDMKQDFGKITEIYKQLKPVHEFPIGIPILDNMLKGGVGRGDLAMLQATTNTGKTWYVLNSCLMNAKKGFNTAFVSLEMVESEVLTRVAMLLLNKSSEEVELKRETNIKDLTEYIDTKMKGNFVLIKDSPGGMTVYDIEQKIKHIKLQYGYILDYLVIDYDDLIQLSGASEKQYMDIGQLYRDLKALAQKYNIGILIAAQLNREAMVSTKSSGLKHTSGSIIKVQVSDLVLHLEDKEEEGLVLRIQKARQGIKNREVFINPDFAHGDLIGTTIDELSSYNIPSVEGTRVKGF